MPLFFWLGRRRYWLLVAYWVLLPSAWAETVLSVAAGGGYKRPANELAAAFTRKTGIRVKTHFGNLQQMLTQAVQSDQLSMVLDDQGYLEKNTRLTFTRFLPVGRGHLVLAWSADRHLTTPEDLARPEFARIAIADLRHATYGKAGSEYLMRTGLVAKIQGNLLVCSTVPQVAADVIKGEVDAGFINLTEALGVQDQLGGYLTLDEHFYDPIYIAFGVIAGRENLPGVQAMTDFLQTAEARAIFSKYGL